MPAIKGADFLCLVHEKSYHVLICLEQGRRGGQDKPRPKRIDNIDFLTSAVWRGATNVELIRPDAATPMLDSKLAGLINTCVEHPRVTSVDLQVNYLNSTSVKNP